MMLPELLDFRGRVGRARFGLTVILGRLILHNVYRILAAALAPYRRGGWDYLALLNRPQAMSHDVKVLLWKAALVTLPFLWVLIATTIKRLRDLETTEWFVFLLLIPAVNVLFFLLLCLQPGCEMQDEAEKRGAGVLGSMLPSSKWGSAVVGAFVGANAGALLSSFSILLLGSYGSTLFLAVPFFMGYIAAWLHGYRQPRSAGESLAVAAGSVAL